MAHSLRTLLKNRLHQARKTVVLGVGSDLRSDDVAGLLVAQSLKTTLKNKSLSRRLKVVFGCTAPENMTGQIRRLKPSHIIIVDSAQMGKKAGAIELIEYGSIDGVSFSTHQLPLEILARYLREELECDVFVIGIQPKSIKFGFAVSREVKSAASRLAAAIAAATSAAA